MSGPSDTARGRQGSPHDDDALPIRSDAPRRSFTPTGAGPESSHAPALALRGIPTPAIEGFSTPSSRRQIIDDSDENPRSRTDPGPFNRQIETTPTDSSRPYSEWSYGASGIRIAKARHQGLSDSPDVPEDELVVNHTVTTRAYDKSTRPPFPTTHIGVLSNNGHIGRPPRSSRSSSEKSKSTIPMTESEIAHQGSILSSDDTDHLDAQRRGSITSPFSDPSDGSSQGKSSPRPSDTHPVLLHIPSAKAQPLWTSFFLTETGTYAHFLGMVHASARLFLLQYMTPEALDTAFRKTPPVWHAKVTDTGVVTKLNRMREADFQAACAILYKAAERHCLVVDVDALIPVEVAMEEPEQVVQVKEEEGDKEQELIEKPKDLSSGSVAGGGETSAKPKGFLKRMIRSVSKGNMKIGEDGV